MPDETNKIYAPLSQVMDSETESNNVTINDGSIGSLSTLEADDQHLMLNGKHTIRRGMSVPRRICFVASIVVILGLVLIFLFVMPCPEDGVCPSGFGHGIRKSWIKDYENLELMGPINIVRVPKTDNVNNLIFMYRKDSFASMLKKVRKPNGVMSILSHTGQIMWYAEMTVEPKYVNCSTVDLNLDGEKDCLIVDIYGQLSCIKAVNGEWLWKTKEYKGDLEEISDYFSFPLVLPDLNGDKINELLHIVRTDEKSQNSFSLLSGKNGRLIGHSIVVSECTFITDLEFAELYTVRYKCHGNGTYTKSIGLNDLYTALTSKSIDVSHLNSSNSLTQCQTGPQNFTKIITDLGNLSLRVENYGVCPNNCSSVISLMQNTTQDGLRLAYNFTARNMFTPPPITFVFKNSHFKYGKFGFVFKYFQWSTDEFGANSTTADSLHIRVVKETVGLIMFNTGTDIKIENTSQNHIMQFCRARNGRENCQPKIVNQRNSMVITDIDRDGSQELITFYATFDSRTKDRSPGQEHLLKTYVQLLDIESEIPKLYGTDRK